MAIIDKIMTIIMKIMAIILSPFFSCRFKLFSIGNVIEIVATIKR